MTKPVDKKEEKILAELPGLYQTDPDRFEKLRKELIRRKIESFPVEFQEQAHCLQFQIEARLRKFKDPVARMNKMVEILWLQFRQFQDVLQKPGHTVKVGEKPKKRAKVIPFPAQARTDCSQTDN